MAVEIQVSSLIKEYVHRFKEDYVNRRWESVEVRIESAANRSTASRCPVDSDGNLNLNTCTPACHDA